MANKATQVAPAEITHEPLVQVDTALMSLRSSNFDTPAAVGEPVDNALQAGANSIKIRLIEGVRNVGKKQSRLQSWNRSRFQTMAPVWTMTL